MTVKWVALSALTALLALAPVSSSSAHNAAGVSAASDADTDFSARGKKYAKTQEGWDRTKKYR